MTATSYTQKAIDVTFQLGTGSFGESGYDTVTLSGLRVEADIVVAGGASMGNAQLRIYGMPLPLMNRLSTLGLLPATLRRNTVTVSAGDASGMATIFDGTIFPGRSLRQPMPDTAFQADAYTGGLAAWRPVAPTSFKGGADAAMILAGLAKQMGFTFENSRNVSVQLANPYFPGTALDQVQECADAAGIDYVLQNGVLAIWPRGNSRAGETVFISPATGMIGYPSFSSQGIDFSTVFNPAIQFGRVIEMQSSLTPANGKWIVRTLAHDLTSQTPGGAWFTRVSAASPGLVVLSN